MNPQELRIGNMVLHNNKPVFIAEILKNDLLAVYTMWGLDECATIRSIRQIPFTDELLLKLDFHKQCSEYEKGHPDYCEWFEHEYPVLGSVYQCDTKEYLLAEINGEELRILYLHQLQNIVHALSGQELEIEL